MQGQDDCREGSASSESCPEPEMVPRGRASVSIPLQSATASPSLEKSPPEAATPATPASEQGSAVTVADDVFSTADEVFSAPDSPHKEFHCAVLRALSKEPAIVEAAEADQAPGTADEAESCLNSSLPLPSSPAQPWPISLHTAALRFWESPPAVSSPLSGGFESAAVVLLCASTLPTLSLISEAFA